MGKNGTSRRGRLRIPDQPALRSWEDVDNALREIGLIDAQIQQMEDEFNKRMAEMKDELVKAGKPLQDRKALLSLRVKEFVEQRRAELKPLRSRQLNHGTVGFRKSTRLVIRNEDEVIEPLKEMGMTDCVIVEEKVNKEHLKRYNDDTLEAVGAKRKVYDNFYIEVKRDALREV